jgi:iron complex outermembrane receptor protein
MSKRTQRDLVDRSGRLARRHTPLSLAIATALALPGLAAAQNAAPASGADEELEEIVVTGFRQALQSSIEIKREATSIVQAVSAEDIGKLPDTSIAESLARLPGIAGQRVNGRTSAIAIRGFGEDFTAASMNGRELLGMGDNRGVEFDLYPSEILSGVTVYKTPTATLMTQGVAGTVDLKTLRPLDADQVINLQGSYEMNEYDALNPDMDDTGYRVAGSYVDQFLGDTLGVALTIASLESPSQEEWFGAWGYPDSRSGNKILGGIKPYARSATLNRDSYAGVLEWQPNEKLHVTADALYIDYLDEQVKRGLETPGAVWGIGNNYTEGTVSDGLVTSGTWRGVAPQIRNDSFEQDADLQVFGINVGYQLTDTWSLMFDGAYNKVDKTLTDIEIYSSVGGRAGSPGQQFDTVGFQMTNRGATMNYGLPYDDFNRVYLAGSQFWGGGNPFNPNSGDDQDGFTNVADFEEDLTTLRLQAEKEFGGDAFRSLQFGVNYSDREKSKVNNGYFLVSPAYPGAQLVPENFRRGTVALDFLGGQRMIAINGRGLYNSGYYQTVSEGETKADRAADTYTITEEVITGYAQLNYDYDYEGVRISGNLGLQYVHSDQQADGFGAQGSSTGVVAIPVSEGYSYDDLLPSFNMALGLTDEVTVRLGASRTMTRTRLDRLKPGSSIVFNYGNNIPGATIERSPWSANSGNPYLEPIKVDQFDLALEYYFAPEGYVAASLFKKDLANWQTNGSVPMDFTQFYYPGLIPANDPALQTCPPKGVCTFDGFSNTTIETQGGTIDGIEFQAALPFNIFTDVLDGFGVLGYYTSIDNKLTINGQQAAIIGLSDRSWGVTGYFEKWGFQARISNSYRSDYTAEVRGLSNTLQTDRVLETELLDAQVSYDFGQGGFDGWLGGLMIFASGQNLTDEPYVQFTNNDPRQITRYSSYGATYMVGARYRF